MFSQCCRSVLRASWRRSHCTSQFSVMSPLVAGGRRELSILSRYNKPPISVPGAEVSPDQEAKDEDVEAILGDDMELEVPRSSTGAEGWKEADHLSAAMAELEAGRRIDDDTLKALGESEEFKAYDEEVTLAVEAVRAGYEVADEPVTTARITQMQAHVQQTINETMEKHADQVARDAMDAMSPAEIEELRAMFYRLEEKNIDVEPDGFLDRDDIMKEFEQASMIMQNLQRAEQAATKEEKHSKKGKKKRGGR